MKAAALATGIMLSASSIGYAAELLEAKTQDESTLPSPLTLMVGKHYYRDAKLSDVPMSLWIDGEGNGSMGFFPKAPHARACRGEYTAHAVLRKDGIVFLKAFVPANMPAWCGDGGKNYKSYHLKVLDGGAKIVSARNPNIEFSTR